MRMRCISLGVCCLGLAGMVYGQDWVAPTNDMVNKGNDRSFMELAAKFAMLQAHEGEMAINQAKSEQVRDYAKTIVQDYTASYGRLSDVSKKTSISIPRGINAGTNDVIIHLTGLKGGQFDRQFLKDEMTADREELIEVKYEAANGKNADVKAFASSMIPVLEKHLRDAEACAKAIGGVKHS